jgi:hypothetical protein
VHHLCMNAVWFCNFSDRDRLHDRRKCASEHNPDLEET